MRQLALPPSEAVGPRRVRARAFFFFTDGRWSGHSPAMLTVRVDTLAAGLVPQLDGLVITGRHDEPSVRGEPESGRAQVTRQLTDTVGPHAASHSHLPALPTTWSRASVRLHVRLCVAQVTLGKWRPSELRQAQGAPRAAHAMWQCAC